jgi:hypothetical protein
VILLNTYLGWVTKSMGSSAVAHWSSQNSDWAACGTVWTGYTFTREFGQLRQCLPCSLKTTVR